MGAARALPAGFGLLSALYFPSPESVHPPSADREHGRSDRMRPGSAPSCRQGARAGCGRTREFLGQTPDLKMGKLRPGESFFVFFISLDEIPIWISIS